MEEKQLPVKQSKSELYKKNTEPLFHERRNSMPQSVNIETKLDSQIVKNQILQKQFLSLIKGTKRLKLIFRGSRDSFKSSAFRQMCCDKGMTLTIIQSKGFNKIFGGYTDIPWSKPGNYGRNRVGTGSSFLFSVVEGGTKIEKLTYKSY